jgi:hypothetical protein
MPLGEARAWLAGRDAYVKGEGWLIDGTYVLESDRTWAALLSLGGGEEFLPSRGGWRGSSRPCGGWITCRCGNATAMTSPCAGSPSVSMTTVT